MLPLALAGCSVTLPPPAEPPARLPYVELDEPPPAGIGRVVINTTAGPSSVDEVVGEAMVHTRYHSGPVAVTRHLGTTPLAVDLPHGVHDLQITSLADERHNDRVRYRFKSGETHGYVRTLGFHDSRHGQAVIGALFTMLGAPMAAGGIPTAIYGPQPIGLTLSVVGGMLAVVGIPLLATARSVEQPGNATWWKIEP